MKNVTRHTGKVENITRQKFLSTNGNPRYTFDIDGYTVWTGVDSSHGYGITNHEGKRATVTIGSHYGRLTLETITDEKRG
tara:strand:+ start:947 stop:1186 length:240 start_codon:yes stop_codon:yes gene_type:complete